MALTMMVRQAVLQELASSYRKKRKKEKGKVLDYLVGVTKYNRSYAARALRKEAKNLASRKNERKKAFLREKKKEEIKGKRRFRKRIYDQEVFLPLRKIWMILDFPCGKRLAPFLKEIVPVLLRYGELEVKEEVKEKLLKLSPATIDRLLQKEKKKYQLKGKARTKPGTLLKRQIPIRTFSEWDEGKPGFMEVDLVSHDGGNLRGDFCHTLNLTDVATGWTESRAVKNKAQIWVFQALKEIRKRLPFDLLGLDSDNGGEFINAHLTKYCQEQEITFTRSRPLRKNDNCYVEEKNYSAVRKNVGYLRYDSEEELETLNELYDLLRLYINFFQPVMKLVTKERIGSRVIKKYDQAKTPFRRIQESPYVSSEVKEKLEEEYLGLNPKELKRAIEKLKGRLFHLALAKSMPLGGEKKEHLEYISI